MAEAGFYHHPSPTEPDGVKCYICSKELDCWDADDDPWMEHKKHSATCPFLEIKDVFKPTVRDILTLEMARQRIHLTAMMTKKIKAWKEEVKLVRNEILKLDK